MNRQFRPPRTTWDLRSTLSPGIGEAYTPTIIGPDGTVYAINAAILNAVGRQTMGTTLSINDVSVVEGNTGTTDAVFTVRLSAPSSQPVTVDFATSDGTAGSGNDYEPTVDHITFAPGETAKHISVRIFGDTDSEADETFAIELRDPINATIARSRGTATILNDDNSLSIDDVTVTEGNSGTTAASFRSCSI